MISLGIDIGGTSIKAAVMNDGTTLWTGRSAPYRLPSSAELMEALRRLLSDAPGDVSSIGLCVPGLLDAASRRITQSINLPCLNDVALDEFVGSALADPKNPSPSLVLLTDVQGAAADIYWSRRLSGRLLLIALGTGVGACVWDEGGPLRVDGESSGHFGQLDVSLEGAAAIGPDGGRGSLEGYVGSAALRARYGDDFASQPSWLNIHEPPLQALARAIRIGHAIYRPHCVCLVGGVGLGLRPSVAALRELICVDLSRIARADWVLECGHDECHAARGAARLCIR